MQTGCVKMLTGFRTVKMGNKQNLNVFRRFNVKPLMYVFPWKVTFVLKQFRSMYSSLWLSEGSGIFLSEA